MIIQIKVIKLKIHCGESIFFFFFGFLNSYSYAVKFSKIRTQSSAITILCLKKYTNSKKVHCHYHLNLNTEKIYWCLFFLFLYHQI